MIDSGLAPAHCAELPNGVPQSDRPLKVAVLVDLTLSPDAGGHVKCWERIAEAAVDFRDRLDLTVHFNGPAERRVELSPSVRYVLMPPVFSTRRLVRQVPDHTDLGLWHRRLARELVNYDVIHTTDAFFCYARTATRFARRRGTPIVSSIHTNTPEYARITVERLLGDVFGERIGPRLANGRLAIASRVSRLLERRLYRHLDRVTMAMASYGGAVEAKFGGLHCGVALRRGLDRALFSPAKRDRTWFESRFGVSRDRFVVMYAGKLNAGKNAQVLAPAVAAAAQGPAPLHLFCPGKGDEAARIAALLGDAATLPGVLAQDELARAYASADLFLFPSTIDESGNAAVEAMACGLPVLLAAGSGVASRMAACGGVRVLSGDDVAAWADAIATLAAEPQQCRRLGALSRAFVEAHVPTWSEVVAEDLLPVWRSAAAVRGRP
ncbi:MAG: glycosyltransferase [Alphaproteobacteria bacterium]|nr:glycosyltransferase [Alphaproteobacteria bacterium]